MFATVLILGVAAFFLYNAFSKGGGGTSSSAIDEDDDMETYDPVRAASDKVYAQAWVNIDTMNEKGPASGPFH